MSLPSLIEAGINFYLDRGGKRVTDEHLAGRLSVCDGCPRSGEVRLLAWKTPGCLECGCPFATKPLFTEYFNPLTVRVEQIVCPLGKWAAVDQQFTSKTSSDATKLQP